MFDWVQKQGGVAEMERRNKEKAALLYDYLDQSKLYHNPVFKEDRSIMNVVFTLPSEELTKKFVAQAKEDNIINIKGHKLVGGLRASIYNGMPKEGVQHLLQFMERFEKENQ